MRRLVQTTLVVLLAAWAMSGLAAAPDPGSSPKPDAAASSDAGTEKLCKPEEMAIVKESLGKTLSAERAAVAATESARQLIAAGTQRYWAKVRTQWLNARAPQQPKTNDAVPTTEAPPSDGDPKVPGGAAEQGRSKPSSETTCQALAGNSPAACAELGPKDGAFCRLLIAVRKGRAGCDAAGEMAGACTYLTGGTSAECTKTSKPQVCELMGKILAKGALSNCGSGGKNKALPCDAVALFLGATQKSDKPCDALKGSEAALCRAVVRGVPQDCASLSKPDPAQTPRRRVEAVVHARLVGSVEGPPRILALATATHPALCHVVITSPDVPGPVWEGVIRAPEYRSLSSVIEADAESEKLAALDPMASSQLTASAHCVERFYW